MRGLECSNCGCPLNRPFTAVVCSEEGTKEYRNNVPKELQSDEGLVIVYRHENCRLQHSGKRQFGGRTGTVLAPMRGSVEYQKEGVRVKSRDGRILLVMPVVENLQE